ncbi:MAG TPA: urate oxidase [Edaphobacter sp.]|nr:urate oxidase [Edaphobacter sp.]
MHTKTRVRLTYVDRSHNPHQVRELSVAILFEGEFTAAYKDGDNSNVLPTDTMKNTVYVLARQLSWNSIEMFAQGIASHFLKRLPQVSQVSVNIEEVPWQQIPGHGAAFFQSRNGRRTTRLRATRALTIVTSGIKGLQIMKTADSSFAGYLKDEFTTLPETHDRLFLTALEAEWQYVERADSFNESHQEVRNILLDRFAQHKSLSVQHTLFEMGSAVLEKVDAVAEIYLVMPNKHCLLVDLSRFGLDNPNVVFIPTDEPSGYIEARITR